LPGSPSLRGYLRESIDSIHNEEKEMNTLYVDGCLKALNDTMEAIDHFYAEFEVQLEAESDDFRKGLRFGFNHVVDKRNEMNAIEREADDLRTMNPFGEGGHVALSEVIENMFWCFSEFDESDAEFERGFRVAYQFIQNQ
jgi:hypothetical protein